MSFENDKALAARCAQGDEAALDAFERETLAKVKVVLARRFNSEQVEEALQQTRTRLLVAEPGARAKILDYQGNAPLLAWVRTVATRIAIDLVDSAEPLDAREDLQLAFDPELDAQARRYQPYFEKAFQAALEKLSRRERVCLRMSVIDGLPNSKIAAVFHVHPSSISRTLAQARASLRENTFLTLQTLLSLGESSAQSLATAIAGQLQASLDRFLLGGLGSQASSSSPVSVTAAK